MKSKYELVVLFQIGAGGSSLESSCAKVRATLSDLGISIEEEVDMGRRQLSYEIKKQRECFYRLFRFSFDSNSETLQSLDRSLGISVDVVRHMLVKQEAENWLPLSSFITGNMKKSVMPIVDSSSQAHSISQPEVL